MLQGRIKLQWWIQNILLFITVFTLTYWYFSHSVQIVVDGQVFRSHSISVNSMERLIKRNHIRSMINLCANGKVPCHDQAKQLAAKLKIHYYDIALPRHDLPSQQQMQLLVKSLKTAPHPVLIHGHSGQDSTSFAAAVAVLMENLPLSAAMQQNHSHAWVASPSSIGSQVLPLYETWLQEHGLRSNRQYFLAWVGHYQKV